MLKPRPTNDGYTELNPKIPGSNSRHRRNRSHLLTASAACPPSRSAAIVYMLEHFLKHDSPVADACARALSHGEVEQWLTNYERRGRAGLYATLRMRCLAAIATASLLLTAPAAHAGRPNEVALAHSIHGGWQLPVTINDTLTIPFVLDTGSFSLQIPLDVYMVMIRQGTVTAADEREEVTIQTADGKSHKEKQFIIHEVKVGNRTLTNVLATISEPGTDLLLGQSFLDRLGRYTIDNQQHTITIEDGIEVATLPPQTPKPPISPPLPPSPDSSSTLSVAMAAYDRGDYSAALLSFQPSAQAGDGFAQYYLGVMYLKGQGVPRNPRLAIEWLAKAASAGYADAQSYMGAFNRRGDLVPQNYAEAVRWYLLAARQNHENSQYRIALMYYQGEGVQRDLREAYMWAVIASAGGEPEPNRLRMKLEQELSASDITEEQRKAAQWRSENILQK